jgi:hypothetical protein
MKIIVKLAFRERGAQYDKHRLKTLTPLANVVKPF